jgi:DHA2 family multidrug resistance protein
MQTQASHLAYIDVFYALTLVAAIIIPLALLLRRVHLGTQTSTPAH